MRWQQIKTDTNSVNRDKQGGNDRLTEWASKINSTNERRPRAETPAQHSLSFFGLMFSFSYPQIFWLFLSVLFPILFVSLINHLVFIIYRFGSFHLVFFSQTHTGGLDSICQDRKWPVCQLKDKTANKNFFVFSCRLKFSKKSVWINFSTVRVGIKFW